MKRLLILSFVVLFLAGCGERAENTEHRGMPAVPEMSSYVISTPAEAVEVKSAPLIKEITIRAVDNGFSPEVISVSKGDRVGMYITNTKRIDVSTFGITGYAVEDFVDTGNTIYLEFVASKTGSFEFGDERSSTRKGMLNVV